MTDKIPLIPKDEIPSEERKFLNFIIKNIEEGSIVSIRKKVMTFSIMIEAAKSVLDLFIEFEEFHRIDPVETNMLKKFNYYMEGYTDALENINKITDFIRTYVPEDYEKYYELYIMGLNMISSSLTETDFPKMINVIGDIDKIIKRDEYLDPEIIWQEIKDYIRQMP